MGGYRFLRLGNTSVCRRLHFKKLQKVYEIRVTLSADSRGRSSLDGLGIARFFFPPAPARWRRRFAPAERDVNTEPELTFRSNISQTSRKLACHGGGLEHHDRGQGQ